jgi:hypothetical protein
MRVKYKLFGILCVIMGIMWENVDKDGNYVGKCG